MDKQQIKMLAFLSYGNARIKCEVRGEILCSDIISAFRYRLSEVLESGELLLTPLSDITDEHAKHIINSVGWDTDDIGKLNSVDLKENRIVFDFEYHHFTVKLSIYIIDYLRSKNYCIPFMGLDLVKEGWAVLKTKDNE